MTKDLHDIHIDSSVLPADQKFISWYFINSRDPYRNLVFEEYLARQVSNGFKEPIVTTYINRKCIVLGRSNKLEEWVYPERCLIKGIPVYRRISGGGTVFHHNYNLNYGFIIPRVLFNTIGLTKPIALEHFCRKMVIDTLAEFDIQAEATGISDISVNGFKISGNAMWMSKSAVLHHGTILFKAYIKEMEYLLPVPPNREANISHKKFVAGLWDLGFIVTPEEIAAGIAVQMANVFNLPVQKVIPSRKELLVTNSQDSVLTCRIL